MVSLYLDIASNEVLATFSPNESTDSARADTW